MKQKLSLLKTINHIFVNLKNLQRLQNVYLHKNHIAEYILIVRNPIENNW